MLVKRRYLSEKNMVCPACGETTGCVEYVFDDKDFESDIFRCQNCTFMFGRPVFIEKLDDRQMDGVENAEMFGSPFMKSIYEKWFLRKELREVCKKINISKPLLLDIGCGTGWTSSYWQNNGFIVHGLEPSRVRSEIARNKYNLEIYDDYLENYHPSNKYDVVLMRHSLEHFEAPEKVLQKVHELLKDDGVVLLIVPNIDCLGRYVFGTDWGWVLPWHSNFFNPRSVKTILHKSGFGGVSIYQTPSPLYFFSSLGRKFHTNCFVNVKGKWRSVLLLISTPFALLGTILGMGDNITAVARKTNKSLTGIC